MLQRFIAGPPCRWKGKYNYDSLCGQKTCNFKLHHSSSNYNHKSGIPVRNDLNLYFLVFGNEDVAEVYR